MIIKELLIFNVIVQMQVLLFMAEQTYRLLLWGAKVCDLSADFCLTRERGTEAWLLLPSSLEQ